MCQQRVTEGEVLQALRSQGIASVEQADAVVLETDGSFSVIARSEEGGPASALRDVRADAERG
jgi:uncharacterized membrane protein YcaP (DUF421 family)